MKHSFKYQGLVNDKAVFTVIQDDESGLGLAGIDVCFKHFKADPTLNIEKVSYLDQDLQTCNTTEHRLNNVVVPPRSKLVTESQTKAFLETLIEADVELTGVGKVKDIDFELVRNYPLEITYPSGKVSYKYYDGVDLEDAKEKAKVNNTAATNISLYEGSMAGKLSY